MKIIVLVFLLGMLSCSYEQVFGSDQKFNAYIEHMGLVGLPVSEATAHLAQQRFNCDPLDKRPITAPVTCGRYIVGWNLAEEVGVSLDRSPDGATVAGVRAFYEPITGP